MTSALARTEDWLGAVLRNSLPGIGEGNIEEYRRTGWTGWVAERIAALTDWAVTEQTWLGREDPSGVARDAADIFTILGGFYEILVHGRRVPVVAALPWLDLLVAAPDEITYRMAAGLLAEDAAQVQDEFGMWRSLGDVGLVAYAAGLTATEAMERCALGMVTPRDLATLARLDGWRLPPR